MAEMWIRIYERDPEYGLVDLKQEYERKDFLNTLPAPGDLIVSPWVSGPTENRRRPEHRTVYEVESRYFLPHAHGEDAVYMALVVKPRPGSEEERGIVTIG